MMERNTRRLLQWTFPVCLILMACGSAGPPRAEAQEGAGPPPDQRPRFTTDGELLRPEGWEAWVLAGTSMGLGYAEPSGAVTAGQPPGSFLNVYIQPWAYERFMETA
ncbi:MAG: hypothetical protein P8Y29_04545, partial [Gemmatimonadota bacterium]